MERDTTTGREKLLTAARELFATQDIETVSLREITRRAGQRNTNAVQYHFGDRKALLLAVLAPHHELVAARRSALLDALDRDSDPPLRVLADALVRPSAAMLAEPGGREYLQIVARLVRDPAAMRERGIADGALGRWDRIAQAAMPKETLPLHRRFSAMQLCFNELGRRAATGRRADHRLFVSDLVDLAVGVLGAPVSDETLDLLTERDSSSGTSAARSRS
ncbi:TetR/AcrR family transcriptional regulator [Actinospongicola halichondriae]|uniref:TetR/AcrR family transcriptional regulator n=1 Tax=Actinospongicola halichondriae TaxID=3236844 RepID=UPI003D3F1915